MSAIRSFLNIFKPVSVGSLTGEKAKFAIIDASLRGPIVFFISAAIVWLLIGTVLALMASMALHSPNLFPSAECLTFGRLRSAHLNAVAFGWANNAVFALGMWVMHRLSLNKLNSPAIPLIAGFLWNFAVTVGIASILFGEITPVEWLEMPKFLSPILALSYVLIGIWGILAFWHRKSDHVYVSQWYILAALFWFPSLYIAVQTMVIWFPARGTVQAITNWWFGHNVLGLWYTPTAVAVAYYTIPKVLGKPIHSYYLSVVGFWTLALFYNWAGVHHLIGGPIPVWLISAGTVASVMMVIPVFVTGINHHLTIVGNFKKVWQSPTLRFTIFGAMSYTLSSFFGSAMALREVNVVTHFTHFTVAHAHHGAYAFFTMIMFGGIYYMMPRILNREWPSAPLIRMHFWACAIGITIYVVFLSIGGWIQGLQMNNADIPFIETVKNTVPWLTARSVGGFCIAAGHIAFFINFYKMLFAPKLQEGPTLFYEDAAKQTN